MSSSLDFHKVCEHCGHVVSAYTVRLNAPLLGAFIAFAEARIRTGAPLPKSDLSLGHSQYGNFQKLRHFGLIEKRVAQCWEMTALGWEFLRGRATVLHPAGQFGNSTLPPDHPAWSTLTEPRKAVSIGDVLPAEWRQRASYAAEKAGAA